MKQDINLRPTSKICSEQQGESSDTKAGLIKATTGGPKRYPDMSIEILNYLQHVHISIVKVYIS